jgi:hypothetical protein
MNFSPPQGGASFFQAKQSSLVNQPRAFLPLFATLQNMCNWLEYVQPRAVAAHRRVRDGARRRTSRLVRWSATCPPGILSHPFRSGCCSRIAQDQSAAQNCIRTRRILCAHPPQVPSAAEGAVFSGTPQVSPRRTRALLQALTSYSAVPWTFAPMLLVCMLQSCSG